MEFVSHSLEETTEGGKQLLASLTPREGATVIGLSGDLGSGKTALVKAMAVELGIDEPITSPTYVIMKSYPVKSETDHGASSFTQLVHIDAYRLKDASELLKLGFADLLRDPGNLILIEWVEIVKGAVPEDYVSLRARFIDENTRQFVW